MKKITKILVATDFTEYSDYAIQAAAAIIKKTGAQLILLHVINRPLSPEDDSYENYHNMPGNNMIVSEIKNKMDDLLKQHNIKDCKIIYELRYDVHQTILKNADRNEVDLIIMGAYGNSGPDETFIGSNTERVMLNAKTPVLIVKEKLKDFNIENMVLASEFYGEIYKIFPKMKDIIDLLETNIHLLKVNTPSRFQKTDVTIKLMEDFANKFALKDHSKNIYNDMTIEDGILNFTKSINADLIAITPDGLWRLVHIFKKNTTDRLMKKSIKVILSMKTNQPTSISFRASNIEDFTAYADDLRRYKGLRP